MKVKTGDKVYDAEDQPIMLILTAADKKNIQRMPEENSKYCVHPTGYSDEEIDEFMGET